MSDYSHLLRWQCPLRGTKFMREDFCDKRRALNHIKTSKKGVLLEKGIEADKKCLECDGPTRLEN